MKILILLTVLLLDYYTTLIAQQPDIRIDLHPNSKQHFFSAANPLIQYTGRIDFRHKALPRTWSPGVYMTMRFTGNLITAVINDQELWNSNHNYLQIIIDDTMKRIQTKAKTNFITLFNLSDGPHTLTICKNTESNIGFIEFAGVYCNELLTPVPKPKRKMEFIGNSITCGASSDASEIPCGKGVWQDQHNAYMAYGSVTARALNAQWHLSSVSGIGLIHSCCNMNIIMPPVFNKIDLRGDSVLWNFKQYQPDVLTVCLGQNDGIQDSAIFCTAYINFIHQLRSYYPKTKIVLLSSPMADEKLKAVLKKQIIAIVNSVNKNSRSKLGYYFFSRSFNGGCDYHPSMEEHQLIAKELTGYLKKLMHW
ncbi:MAG: SGNH/GDSL hydrolase family protein [Ferruginibacter sp.]